MNKRRWLLPLYPRAWRQRYEDEFVALLEQQQRHSLRDILDIVLGALDARLRSYIPDPIQTVEKLVSAPEGERKMDRSRLYRNIPSKGRLEITVALSNEQHSGPRGSSLAELRARAEGDEVTVKGPKGETYKFSLAPWANDDAHQTFLTMTYQHKPEYPILFDQTVLNNFPFPPPHTHSESSDLTSTAIPGPGTVLKARPSPNPIPSSSFIASELQGHKIVVRESKQPTGISLKDLFALREIAMDTDILCPLCDTPLHVYGSWQQFFNLAATNPGDGEAMLEVIISHPGDLPETKTLAEDYPFTVQRHWRFTPFITPSSHDLANIFKEVDFSVAIKSHDHFITIQPTLDGTSSAAKLLSLPTTHVKDIACPLCDTTLHSQEPLAKAIKLLSDALEEDTTGIEVRISHPQNVPETKTPPVDYPFQVQRHDKPLDSGLQRSLNESSPTFMVKPR